MLTGMVTMLATVAWDTVFVAGAASTAPLFVVMANGWVARKAKQEDWARQDAMTSAAERAVEATEATAAAAKEIVATNMLASEQANASADRAAEQADRAAEQIAQSRDTIDSIHTLVNSNLTAALKGQLAAVTGQLAVTRIVARRDTGPDGIEAEGAVKVLEAQVAELTSQVEDRAQAQQIVDDKTS